MSSSFFDDFHEILKTQHVFSLFLAHGGPGWVALGSLFGSRDRCFSLSFSVQVGHGCPKHIVFLDIFYRTLVFH